MKHFTGCTLAVLVVCMLAREAQAGVTIMLGDPDGWTNKANVDYNKWLSNTKVKIGDTVQFNNWDSSDHTVMQVDKLGYDTCGKSGQKSSTFTISPVTYYQITFLVSGPVYVICDLPGHCVQGMKVYIEVLNADGTVNTTAADTGNKSGASQMPGFSWTSQLMIVVVAAFSLMAAAATM